MKDKRDLPGAKEFLHDTFLQKQTSCVEKKEEYNSQLAKCNHVRDLQHGFT